LPFELRSRSPPIRASTRLEKLDAATAEKKGKKYGREFHLVCLFDLLVIMIFDSVRSRMIS
jgi:hypothetical protein